MIIAKDYRLKSGTIELLKYIAIFLMVFDHADSLFLEQHSLLKVVGRVVFPLFAIIIAYNYIYNCSSKIGYIKRLAIFAIISEPFYYLYIQAYTSFYSANIIFTLLFGVMLMYIYEMENLLIKITAGILMLLFIACFDNYISYGAIGVILIFSLYLFFRYRYILFALASIFLLAFINMHNPVLLHYFALASIPLVIYINKFVNFNIPRINKYFFYYFYPLHLFLLFLIHSFLN